MIKILMWHIIQGESLVLTVTNSFGIDLSATVKIAWLMLFIHVFWSILLLEWIFLYKISFRQFFFQLCVRVDIGKIF